MNVQALAIGPSMKALAVVLKALLQQAGLNERVAGGPGLLLPPQPCHGPPPVPGNLARRSYLSHVCGRTCCQLPCETIYSLLPYLSHVCVSEPVSASMG